jgi:hypothetical protein
MDSCYEIADQAARGPMFQYGFPIIPGGPKWWHSPLIFFALAILVRKVWNIRPGHSGAESVEYRRTTSRVFRGPYFWYSLPSFSSSQKR